MDLPRRDARAPREADCRCSCGNLLARLVPGGVELKCRRCKRTHVVPLSANPRTTEARGRAPRVQPDGSARAAPREASSPPCLDASSSAS